MTWRPSATLEILRQRSALLRIIREFFFERNILEVETPIVAQAGVSDPYLVNLSTQLTIPGLLNNHRYYLQTSPEYHMKRLLAAGSGCIFQFIKAFRDHEFGRMHNSEFTMLEWYRVGYDHIRLMDEVNDLLQVVLSSPAAQRLSYQDAFLQYLAINPFTTTISELQACSIKHNIAICHEGMNKDDWLSLLFSHLIEPKLGFHQPVFIYNYPPSQAALATIQDGFAQRFEVFMNGIELANGYHELCDHEEQLRRFNHDQKSRAEKNIAPAKVDEKLLAALEHGLPACAGVALGFDRLCMIALNQVTVADVLSFTSEHA